MITKFFGRIGEIIESIPEAIERGPLTAIRVIVLSVLRLIKIIVISSIKQIGFVVIIFVLIGFFLYDGSWQAALGILLLIFLLKLTAIVVGWMPIFGLVFYWLIGARWIMPWIFDLTGIYGTWLTTVIYWLYFIVACGMGFFGALIIIGVLVAIFWR